MFVADCAKKLPRGFGLSGRDVFAVSGGAPLLLCSFNNMLYEVGELVGFGGMQLCRELLLELLYCLLKVVGELSVLRESRCGEVFADLVLSAVWL